MIQVFKILKGIYNVQLAPALTKACNTRGNSLKLQSVYHKYDITKYSFSSRVVKVWNTFPDHVVAADSVNKFKNQIDKHWLQHEFYLDYTCNLPGHIY